MNKIKPKMFSTMKTYNKEQFFKDVVAGIIVAIIALPLSIALAIASGVNPERGLYTAIIAGFFISFLGGSRVQIGGPTAAFVVIIYGIVTKFGINGLIVATIMAGIILIIMGFCRFGNLIKFIPNTITTGFTAGIAVCIFVGQLKDFFGLKLDKVPSEFIEEMMDYGKHMDSINYQAVIIGVIALAILVLWPKVTEVVPASIIAIVVTTLIVKYSDFEVNTIGSVFGTLSAKLPTFSIPNFDLTMIKDLLPSAFTIAILAAIESLLSCVVSDGMINSRHRSNMELIGQGVGNLMSGLFGGIPATGAIARTAANVKNGGRTPVAGMVHSITLLLILVLLMPLASLIPMPTLAAILIVVAINMCEWKSFVHMIKVAPKSDITVLLVTFFLTVVFDLVVAIEVGIVITSLLFMKRMADVSNIRGWTYKSEDDTTENDPMHISLKKIPDSVLVYEIDGPMFFAAADNFLKISLDESKEVLILRMRSVPAMDVTALSSLVKVQKKCEKYHIVLIMAHVQEQPYHAMKKAGFVERVGEENFVENIDAALELANKIIK